MTRTSFPPATGRTPRVVVLVGSLRRGSLNRRLAEGLRDRAAAARDVEVDLVEDLGALPFFDPDLDTDADRPDAVTALRARVAAADAVLAVTPEYNGGMPAVLANAIDWLSRPYRAGALVGRPFGVVGTTPSPYGGRWAHEAVLRAAGIAGALPVEEVTVSHPGGTAATVEGPAVEAALDAALRGLVARERAAA